MIEKTIVSFELPYRDPLDVRAFLFGVDARQRRIGEGADTEELQPTLCLVAGVRGDEAQQTLVCALLVEQLRHMEQMGALLPGNLIQVIPCANPASMSIGRRFWPGDKTDINRMFPGDESGEATQRVAAALFEQVKGFRYGIHLSSFYLEGVFLPHVRVMHGPGETENHGCDFGLPYVAHHIPSSFDTTTLHYNWRRYGTEAYSLYTKETNVINEESAQESVRAVLRFMNARGMLGQPTLGGARTVELDEEQLVPVYVPAGGIFCPRAEVGAVVEKGRLLAQVIDTLRGTVKCTLAAPCNGMVFYRARTPLVNEETLAFRLVPPLVGPHQ